MNELKNLKNDYIVFRAYDVYWIIDSRLVEKLSANISDIRVVCGVNKISINQVMEKAKDIVHSNSIKYEPFMAVKIGDTK